MASKTPLEIFIRESISGLNIDDGPSTSSYVTGNKNRSPKSEITETRFSTSVPTNAIEVASRQNLVCAICKEPVDDYRCGVFACDSCMRVYRKSVVNDLIHICPLINMCELAGKIDEDTGICKNCRHQRCQNCEMHQPGYNYKLFEGYIGKKKDFLRDQALKPGLKLNGYAYEFLKSLDKANVHTYTEVELTGTSPPIILSGTRSDFNIAFKLVNEEGNDADRFCMLVNEYLKLEEFVLYTISPQAMWMIKIFRLCTRYSEATRGYVYPMFPLLDLSPNLLEACFRAPVIKRMAALAIEIHQNLKVENYYLMEGLCLLEAVKRVWDERIGIKPISEKYIKVIEIYAKQKHYSLWGFMTFCSEEIYQIVEVIKNSPKGPKLLTTESETDTDDSDYSL